MKRLFTSSELSKQHRDWHHALVRAEEGDKPYLISDDQAYRTMRPGAYLVEVQRNRNGATMTYTWISDKQAKEILDSAERNREEAEDKLARASVA